MILAPREGWGGLLLRWFAFGSAAWLCVAAIEPALGQTVRFSPGEDTPIALNSATNTYEEGASFDPLVCAEQPCIELLHNIFEPLVTTSPDHEFEPCLAVKWERRDEISLTMRLCAALAAMISSIGLNTAP